MSAPLSTTAEALQAERRELLQAVPHMQALEWCERQTDIVDRAIRSVYAELISEFDEIPDVAVVATGGYGRRELAPFSDVDVTVVPIEGHPHLDALVRELHKRLHHLLDDVLGLEVGYSYRLISDADALDPETRTAFLDSRVAAGSWSPYNAFMDRFWRNFPVGEFLLDKLRERERAFRKWNDTPLVVEPHVKEGAGGLRSFHCANWIREVTGEQPLRSSLEYRQMLRLRNLIHYCTGKRQELFTRQRQAEIADLIGEEVFELASTVARAGSTLHDGYLRAVDRLHDTRFELMPGVSIWAGEVRIAGGTPAGSAALGISIATQLGFYTSELPVGTSAEVSGPEAMFALSSGEASIRNLDKCRLLRILLPELTACRTLMPRDSSHAFTVFEHTLRVVRNLENTPPGSFWHELAEEVQDKGVLYLAALLHDVGKVDSERRHSELGAEMAREVGRRWRLSEGVTEKVSWLVREHLSMASFSRLRDLQDPRTATEFAELVGTRERLVLLTLLTYADIAAVSEETWTPVTESFLRELFERTAEVLDTNVPPALDASLYRRRLMRELRQSEVPPEDLEAFLDSLPAHYVLSTPPDIVRLHMAYEGKAKSGEPIVELVSPPGQSISELTVAVLDQPGLLSRILGVIYALDLRVHSIRASTTAASRVALDTFTVSFGDRQVPPATTDHVAASLLAVLKNERDYRELLRNSGKDPDRQQEFFDFTYIEGDPGILEIQAPRGRGMAYRFSKLIAEQGWNIVGARLGQWAGRATAAFYLLSAEGTPLAERDVKAALQAQV